MREDDLRRLISLLEENESLAEIELTRWPLLGWRRIRVARRQGGMPFREAAMIPSEAPAAAGSVADAQTPLAEDDDHHIVKSPMVGTFYSAPSPGAPPFVGEGARVSPGTVLCIIEAMKLMNEIECDISGTLRELLVENGEPVEFGQALFRIERD